MEFVYKNIVSDGGKSNFKSLIKFNDNRKLFNIS
jgi:hypothetical protein